MKKIIILSFVLCTGIITSCTDDLTSLNNNRKRSTEAPAPTLFANAERNLVDIMTTPNVNSNIFRLLSQQWTETTYTDESRYDLGTRNIPQNFWNTLYRDVIADLKESKRVVKAADPTFSDPVVNENQWQIAEILEVYAWSVLTTTYGDIPYSAALDIENVFPAYEDDEEIHRDLIQRLDAAMAKLDPTAESLGTFDLIYEGDVAEWMKFANSLKLRLGMMLADVDPTTARSVVEQAVAAGVLESNDDNASFPYLESSPNTNPVWVNLVQSGRRDFVAANTIVDLMSDLNDPRVPLFFGTDREGGFTGGIYGSSNSYSAYSKPSSTITDPENPGVLISYSEVEFFLAEAAARGFNVGGTAQQHYNAAITASILEWGGTEEDAMAYLAQPEVAYATAQGDFRQKIGTQKWIALYNRGHEAWTEYRRLDAPEFNEVESPIGDFPVRYPYPVNEQNLNTANYQAASTAMGGDLVTTRLFWDIQ
jgi:hypothetical protein